MRRSYEPIIRVNTQSGKGGVSFLLERDYGIKLPRKLQNELSRIQQITDVTGREVTSAEIWHAFEAECIERQTPFTIRAHSEHSVGEIVQLTATVSDRSTERVILSAGNWPDRRIRASFERGVRRCRSYSGLQRARGGERSGRKAVSFV